MKPLATSNSEDIGTPGPLLGVTEHAGSIRRVRISGTGGAYVLLEALRESLEQTVSELEDLLNEHSGDLEQPVVCIDCFNIESCLCKAPRWPIFHALAKLKSDLRGP